MGTKFKLTHTMLSSYFESKLELFLLFYPTLFLLYYLHNRNKERRGKTDKNTWEVRAKPKFRNKTIPNFHSKMQYRSTCSLTPICYLNSATQKSLPTSWTYHLSMCLWRQHPFSLMVQNETETVTTSFNLFYVFFRNHDATGKGESQNLALNLIPIVDLNI